ncbi:MAG: SpoIIE family protein phosphatase [Cytophagales bacterium]|nr:SpoIIE family protein phosphatase [Cytophagales bacterium]
MNTLVRFLCFCFLFTSVAHFQVQSQIKGKVVDAKGTPVEGVNIKINKLKPVVSDKNGMFKLESSKLDFPIVPVVSKEGFQLAELDFDEENNFLTIDLEGHTNAITKKKPVATGLEEKKFKVLVIDSLSIPLAHVKLVIQDVVYYSDGQGLVLLETLPQLENISSPIFEIMSSKKTADQITLILKPYHVMSALELKQAMEVENNLFYDHYFNVLAEDIQQERTILIQYSAKIQSEILSITKRLKNDTLISATKRKELENKVVMLEDKLIESRAALMKSDDKTGSLIRQLKKIIVKKDSIQAVTKAKLATVTIEKEAADFKVLIYASLTGLFLVLSVLLYFLYAKIQLKNKEIKQKSDKIAEQNVVINKHLDEVSQSIHAAKIIQNSILPPLDRIHQYLPQCLVYYKPKDIVGGDFYWFRVKNDIIYIAAIDCTGHGVPGALTSMMGFNILNQVFQQFDVPDPAVILNEVNLRFIRSTSNDNTEVLKSSLDGMDVSICKINVGEKKLDYAGAKLPLFLVRNNELLSSKGSAFPIGTVRNGKLPEYTYETLDLLPNDMIYISSDGYTSQMGGPDGTEKYNNSRFKKLLLNIASKSINDQIGLIDKDFVDWKGKYDQLDDILVIGFKI